MRRKSRALFRAAFLAPAVLIYGGFVIYPLLQAFMLAFYKLSGLSTKKRFVGLANFERIFSDGVFVQALIHNLILLGVALILIMVIGLPVAHAAQGESKLAKLVRGVYLFPHMISMVIVGILWGFIFHPKIGMITNGLELIGIKDVPAWTGDTRTALYTIVVAFVWYMLGFYIMIFASGLKSISEDVTEAASLDGAKGMRRFWLITWPLIWPMRRIAVIHACIGALNTFALVRLMTAGGPDRASEVTLTYLYERGFQPNSFYGEATAIALLNFLAVMLVAGVVVLAFGKNPVEARR